MRASIPHPIRERRQHRHPQEKRATTGAGALILEPSDPAVQRAREAGGPADQASYSCECGYVFLASVSTTVKCPHCDAGQAW